MHHFIEHSQQLYELGNHDAVLYGLRKLSNLGEIRNIQLAGQSRSEIRRLTCKSLFIFLQFAAKHVRFWASASSSARDTDGRKSLPRLWDRPRPFLLTREGAMCTPKACLEGKGIGHFLHISLFSSGIEFPYLSPRVPMITEKAKALDLILYEMKISGLTFF